MARSLRSSLLMLGGLLVWSCTGDQTPLPEVSVTITVQANLGSFTLSGTTTRVTGSDGIATFPDLSLDKPGGYVFVATSTLVGFAPAQVNSGMFHITF